MSWSSHVWGGLALGLLGCVPTINPRPPVRVQPTRTPGVALVIVRPEFGRSRNSADVDRSSEYILLCDGRPADGMRCQILPEVGADRRSLAVTPGGLGPDIDLGVATLTDVDTTRTEQQPDDAAEATSAAGAQPVATAVPSVLSPAAAPSSAVSP